MAIISTRHAT